MSNYATVHEIVFAVRICLLHSKMTVLFVDYTTVTLTHTSWLKMNERNCEHFVIYYLQFLTEYHFVHSMIQDLCVSLFW
jgi:hypothetical protein